jgi:hypothetical protein
MEAAKKAEEDEIEVIECPGYESTINFGRRF